MGDIFEEPHYTVICDQQQVFSTLAIKLENRNQTELK